MLTTIINRFGGSMPSSAREDKKALDLARQLTMLGFNPYNGGGAQHGGMLESQYRDEAARELRRSSNMTECVPVPSSEHVAEIVGRQGCKIKALRAKTNTYIKTPVRGEDPVFVVTGRREDVACAKREILSAADHFSQIRATRRSSTTGSNGGSSGGGGGMLPPNPGSSGTSLSLASAAACSGAATSAATVPGCRPTMPTSLSLLSGGGAGAPAAGGGSSSSGGVCSTCKQPSHVTVHVRVPYHVVGLVVGPKGATIKRIQQSTQTYIVTPSRDKEPVFEVTGHVDSVEKAKQEIEKHIAARTGGSSASSSGSESGSSCAGVADEDDFHCNGVDSAYYDDSASLDAAAGSGLASSGTSLPFAMRDHAVADTTASSARDLFSFGTEPSAAMSDFGRCRLRSAGTASSFDHLLEAQGLGKSVGCVAAAAAAADVSAASACSRMPFWSDALAGSGSCDGAVAVGMAPSLLPGSAAAVGTPLPSKPCVQPIGAAVGGSGSVCSREQVSSTTTCRLPPPQPLLHLAREMACGTSSISGTGAAAPSRGSGSLGSPVLDVSRQGGLCLGYPQAAADMAAYASEVTTRCPL